MTPRTRTLFAAAALCAITLLAYANSFDAGFVIDNRFFVLIDSRVHEATLANLRLIFNHTYWWPYAESGLYRPIATLSYLFNYAILGNADRPAGYHWLNLLLHAGNVLLVFALARRLAGDFLLPFAIAAVWAVHPVLTESVTNIVGRADLLAGMTILGGLLIYLKSTEAAGWRRMAWLAALMAITAAGVFCKESAVVVVGVIALYEITWWKPERVRGFLLACLAMLPGFLALGWARSRALAGTPPPLFPFIDNPIVGAGFRIGRLTAVKVMAKDVGLLVWPAHLSADYSYAQIPLADGRLTDWIAWLVVAGLAIAVALLYRRNKPAFFAAGFAFATLLPASNLVIPVGTIMAERFLYLPAIGFAVCLILALDSIVGRAGATAVVGLLIAAAFGARTWARNADWRDDVTIWSAAARDSPLSFKAHASLARALDGAHLDPARVIPARVVEEDERSIAILDSLPDRMNSARPWFAVAAQYVTMGDRLGLQNPESRRRYERARSLALRGMSIQQAHHDADADIYPYLLLSETDQRLGRNDESLDWARQARRAGPKSAAVYLRIHDVELAAGHPAEARTALLVGVLVTSDADLQQKLVADYANDPDGGKCAISYAEATPQINFSCAAVHKQVCAVAGELGAKYGCPIH